MDRGSTFACLAAALCLSRVGRQHCPYLIAKPLVCWLPVPALGNSFSWWAKACECVVLTKQHWIDELASSSQWPRQMTCTRQHVQDQGEPNIGRNYLLGTLTFLILFTFDIAQLSSIQTSNALYKSHWGELVQQSNICKIA